MHAVPPTAVRISLSIVLGASIAACGQAAVPATTGPTASVTPTNQRTTGPTPSPTAMPAPTRVAPTTDLPEGYSAAKTVGFGFGLVADGVLIGTNMDTGTVYRWDARTYADLGAIQAGPGDGFPPDAQSVAAGTGGVWVNLASQGAVGLINPATGKFVRRVEIPGHPYDMVEVDGDLWIVDFGWSQITRYDLGSDTVLATTAVSNPTDVIFAEGTIWVPNHYGRAEEAEPITAGAGVVRIDPATNKVAATIKVGPRPYYMAAGFGAAWTGTATGGSVERIDAATNEVTTIWIGEDGAFDIEVVGDSVWVVVGPQWPVERACDPETSFFVRIDPKTNATRERVAFPCPGSITPAGTGFWVSGQGSDGPISTFFEPIG